jgi:deoxyhypusine synthase
MENTNLPASVLNAVLQESVILPENTPQVKGYDFNEGVNYDDLLKTYVNSGFQATNFGKAVNEINKMVSRS